MADERISLSEAARRSGVPASTLKRWAEEKIVPVRRGRWTAAAAAQARVVARMRERGYSLEDLKEAGREGRLAFGFAEELFSGADEASHDRAGVAEETGLEPELIERILVILGTPKGRSASSARRTRRRCATAPASSPPASRSSPSCSWSASTCSRCGGSPTPRCASSTSTSTNR